jgi:hypothetical protein
MMTRVEAPDETAARTASSVVCAADGTASALRASNAAAI